MAASEDDPRGADTPAPPSTAVAVGRFRQQDPGYGATRSRGAPGWVLLHTVSGAGDVRQGPGRVVLRPGQVAVLGAEAQHSYHVDRDARDWDCWWVHFPIQPGWREWLERGRVTDDLFVLGDDHTTMRIGRIWARLYEDLGGTVGDLLVTRAAGSSWWQRRLALNAVEELILVAAAAHDRRRSVQDERIAQAETMINAKPAVTVDELAAHAHLSVSRFSHLFTEVVGASPNQRIVAARMESARALLETSDLSVADIARRCGYPNQYYFSRVFRARFGSSPRTYRGIVHGDTTPT